VRARATLIPLLACLALLGAPRLAGAQARGPIAVILNPSNPENGLATEDLRHLYLGVRTAFPNRAPVLLVALPALRERFYAAALGMGDAQFRRYWMGLVFSGDSALPPVEVGTEDAVKQLVARHRGAVGFIDAAAADPSVKVITIDGLRPDDPQYPLR
jgi:ABC-type phosphate transport system substrate-binding protein